MWLIKLTLVVALATAGWAVAPDIVNIPADGKLSEGKYVIYDKDGAEEASVLVTKDMLRTGEENNLRTLHSWLNKYFDKEDKKRPSHHYEHGPYDPYYMYGPGHGHGHPAAGSQTSHPAVTVVNGITQEHGSTHSHVGSAHGGTVIPPGAIVIRPASTTSRPSTYPETVHHHYHPDPSHPSHPSHPDYHHNYPAGSTHPNYPAGSTRPNYPSRPNYPNRPDYPDRYPHRYPDGHNHGYPDGHHHGYPDGYPDRYPGNHHHPDRDHDRDRFDRDRFDRDHDRDRYPYDRFPTGRYPYDEYNGYEGHHVYPYGPWAKMQRSAAAAPRGFFPVYAHQLAAVKA